LDDFGLVWEATDGNKGSRFGFRLFDIFWRKEENALATGAFELRGIAGAAFHDAQMNHRGDVAQTTVRPAFD
jgi:hypothetical protein